MKVTKKKLRNQKTTSSIQDVHLYQSVPKETKISCEKCWFFDNGKCLNSKVKSLRKIKNLFHGNIITEEMKNICRDSFCFLSVDEAFSLKISNFQFTKDGEKLKTYFESIFEKKMKTTKKEII